MATAQAEYITITEAVERFGISRDRLRKWVERKIVHEHGYLESDGRRPVLIDPNEVREVIARLGLEPQLGRPRRSR